LTSLTDIVQKSDTPAGRAFDVVTIILIIVSIVEVAIETLPNLSPRIRAGLRVSEMAITVAFTIEYALRIVTSERPLRYIRSFYGIVDLVAILPFYLSLGVDLRGVRAFRLIRVFRLFKLSRYTAAVDRFAKAIHIAKEEIVLFTLTAAVLLYLSACGIYYFEHAAQPDKFQSIPHSLWWAVATLTTVGYGDVYPITTGGKIFTFCVLMVGLGIVAVPAGLIASALSEVREGERQRQTSETVD
jgi:voltage-gated potassium channel